MRKMIFILAGGTRREVDAPAGLSVLEIAHRSDIPLEGECGGSCACSTCHVVVKPNDFKRLSEPDEQEEDILDLAFGLTTTSRLACQIIMAEWLDGLTVTVPAATQNIDISRIAVGDHSSAAPPAANAQAVRGNGVAPGGSVHSRPDDGKG